MKNRFNLILFSVLAVAGITSCEDSNQTVDQVTSDVTRGAVLRTIDASGTFNRFDTSSTFNLEIEAQDIEDGALLSEVEVFANFTDNTAANGETTTTEALVTTIPSSSFTTGPFGLPRATFSTTLADALSSLGVVDGQFDGGDEITYRLNLKLTDGRAFTSTDNTNTITQLFFRSPFQYRQVIKCIPTSPVPGDYEFQLRDSYGDGWDGAKLEVTIDGTTSEVTFTSGSEFDTTVTVPPGTTEFNVVYVTGSFEGEHSYTIIAPTGETAISDGPSPAAGTLVFNICNG